MASQTCLLRKSPSLRPSGSVRSQASVSPERRVLSISGTERAHRSGTEPAHRSGTEPATPPGSLGPMARDDLFRRSFEAGTAFLDMTRDRAEALVKELVKAGEVQKGKAQKAIDEVLERS